MSHFKAAGWTNGDVTLRLTAGKWAFKVNMCTVLYGITDRKSSPTLYKSGCQWICTTLVHHLPGIRYYRHDSVLVLVDVRVAKSEQSREEWPARALSVEDGRGRGSMCLSVSKHLKHLVVCRAVRYDICRSNKVLAAAIDKVDGA